MTTPNPLDYAAPNQDTTPAKRRRNAWIIFASSVILSPVVVYALYGLTAVPLPFLWADTIYNPYLILLVLHNFESGWVFWTVALAELPIYGAIIAIAYYKRKTRWVVIILAIIHAIVTVLALYSLVEAIGYVQ